MKTLLKILTALAAIAGAVFVVATYGDKIVAFAKKLLGKCPCCEAEEAPVDELAEEEPAAEEVPVVEEEPAPEVVVAENEPVAEEADFAE